MNRNKSILEGLIFSAITLGLSYFVFWGPLVLIKVPAISFVRDTRGPIWAIILFILGGFVPSAVAIVLTRIREGTDGLKSLMRRCLQFRLGIRWYIAIVIVVVLGGSGQLIIHSMLGNSFDLSLYLRQLPSFLPLIIVGPISEELGWRGYLLQKLQLKWNALLSSIFVGIVWAFWHLPLFFVIGTSQHELQLPFTGFFVGTVAVSIIYTWINNNTNNSIWAAILLHWFHTYVAQVNSTGVTRSTEYNWLEFVPYVLIAIAVVAIWKPKHLMLRHTQSESAPTIR